MEQSQTLGQFFLQQGGKILEQTVTHLELTFISLIISIVVAVPLGILIARKQKVAGVVLGFVGVLQTIPSIALLGFLIPFLGIGMLPAIVVLFMYALLPIVRNTYTGITQVDRSVLEAATAIGMSQSQRLWKVELPLAFPVIMSGIRTAAVINVGVATLAAFIAAGGLGEFIFAGIALNNSNMILAGAIPAAVLAIILDHLFALFRGISIRSIKAVSIVVPVFLLAAAWINFAPFGAGKEMLAGFEPEFMGRQDGYPGLKKVYGLDMNTVMIHDAMMYKGIDDGKLDVIGGYSTDGRVKAYNLVILEDDQHNFPPYHAAPVVRMDFLKSHPEVEEVLNLLAGKITDSVMIAMNYKVDHLKQSPEQVAKEFLLQHGLWREPQSGKGGVFRIGSKVFTEQYTLASIYSMLIAGHTQLKPVTSTGLGGTKICFDALLNNQIDFYVEYTGTGLLVILHPDEQTLKRVLLSADSVYNYVQQEFQSQYNLKWTQPLGFNNSYALMMRKEEAESLGITTISQLSDYLKND
ncbi:ABC transporter permease/substrate-binding protein [Cesiribacter sp. SM1]|uniref:ABC transporter permease/substrate-binding protein n=1 Tax=Cesiribacter sp. SM1 TaxID=2861196 RepID=UPI001CD75681|nr:ABC transporter permease/substrate-binding protein [Cesiribacter sp. SM1]